MDIAGLKSVASYCSKIAIKVVQQSYSLTESTKLQNSIILIGQTLSNTLIVQDSHRPVLTFVDSHSEVHCDQM